MKNLTYLSPKTEKRSSLIHGTGLFAISPIYKGEIVAVKGGYIMSKAEWSRIEPQVGSAAEIQISDELVIAPRTSEELEGCMMALNHSCDPNIGVKGQITYVSMRNINEDEQLCLDYSMIDNYEGIFKCNCGTVGCREIVSGKDWQRSELQKKYRGYFATFIEEKIGPATT